MNLITANFRVRNSNYESAWTWDIFLLSMLDEMVSASYQRRPMASNEYLDDVHVRMLRVTEDLRAISQRSRAVAAFRQLEEPQAQLSLIPKLLTSPGSSDGPRPDPFEPPCNRRITGAARFRELARVAQAHGERRSYGPPGRRVRHRL